MLFLAHIIFYIVMFVGIYLGQVACHKIKEQCNPKINDKKVYLMNAFLYASLLTVVSNFSELGD